MDPDRAIEWMKANGMELKPWQETYFRALLAHDGDVAVMNTRRY